MNSDWSFERLVQLLCDPVSLTLLVDDAELLDLYWVLVRSKVESKCLYSRRNVAKKVYLYS